MTFRVIARILCVIGRPPNVLAATPAVGRLIGYVVVGLSAISAPRGLPLRLGEQGPGPLALLVLAHGKVELLVAARRHADSWAARSRMAQMRAARRVRTGRGRGACARGRAGGYAGGYAGAAGRPRGAGATRRCVRVETRWSRAGVVGGEAGRTTDAATAGTSE